ncbi:MAG: membrane protein insertion efficiency factor YidD [Rhodospirillales bacterium]|nr:membrane protein insertion efficiency factor YidD [Rhodospirillales bacterium]
MKFLIIWPVRLYQVLLSPWLGHHCRYHPTCSRYMIEAVTRHGVLKGGYLGSRRLLRCHPLARCEPLDPVPQTFAWRQILGYKNPQDQKHLKDTLKDNP